MASPQPFIYLSDPRFLEHDTGDDHPERAERLLAIEERLGRGSLTDILTRAAPRPAERSWLTSVHSENYLLRLEETILSGRSHVDHPDNQVSFASYQVALLAAGAGPSGIDLLEAGGVGSVFCAVRPPGHHAERAMAMGFCFLNNCAIAARYWQQRYQRRRIAIIDWDAHHGNGIQAIAEQDPEILYVSIHEHPTWSFPGTGYRGETGLGNCLNLPLPPGTGDQPVLAAATRQIEPALARFRPEALLIAAGFDGHRDDDMSGLVYSTGLYRRLGSLAAVWAERYCHGRLLTMLEGGYQPPALAGAVEAYLLGVTSENR